MKRHWSIILLGVLRFWIITALVLRAFVPDACGVADGRVHCDIDGEFIGLMLLAAFPIAHSLWLAWQQSGLRIDASGISMPALGGPIVILWSGIPDVAHTKRGIEIRKGTKRIILNPWFVKSKQVAAIIAAHLDAARKKRVPPAPARA